MALVSPGLQLSVTDESQYVPGAVGTVPLVVLATAQDKIFNGGIASGTTVSNAGKLQVFTSQRELATALGYPTFEQTAAGTPVHGGELNEYGAMATYSALGLGNQAYVIRADVDLDSLQGTSIRPKSDVATGTYWVDLAETTFGIHEWNATTGAFTLKSPLVVSSVNDIDPTTLNSTPTPKTTVGAIGSYAVVVYDQYNRTFYKNSTNAWVQVNTTDWQTSWPALTSSNTSPTITASSNIIINGSNVTVLGTTVANVAATINAASITGVTAGYTTSNQLKIYVTSAATSNQGKVTLADGTNSPLAAMGITAGVYWSPTVNLGTYVAAPSWRSSDTAPRPTGSVWFKSGATGNGSVTGLKKFNATSGIWSSLAVLPFANETTAIYGLDPSGGGAGIAVGTVFSKLTNSVLSTPAMSRLMVRARSGAMVVTGSNTDPSGFLDGAGLGDADQFTLAVTQPGASTSTSYTITLSGTEATDFVNDILSANIPNVSARIEDSGAISIIHSAGGNIVATNLTGTPLTTAGFTSSTTNVRLIDSSLVFSNFDWLTSYQVGYDTPYQAPVTGTHWFYSSATEVDIMINNGSGWKGYQNVSNDARGYNLAATDPGGVIVSASKPTSQSDNSGLEPGDIWLDTSDLENYPKLYRYTGTAWSAIDNTDRVSQNGIVFADARWDTDGTSDIIADAFPTIASLLTSDYLDLDAPDYRLYPRGTLLFNTRRSGYNVKKFVADYFSEDNYPNVGANSIGLPSALPDVKDAWVTDSGLRDNGAPNMGRFAQRAVVVSALKAAIDGSTEIREEQFKFNIIACPGYPELIPNMVSLNNDRANTAFVIGDAPMGLAPNGVDIANWSNNTNGDGITTADPYLGIYYPSALTNDLGGDTISVPASHIMLRTFIRNDNVSYPWFAPAGVRRGLVDNATDIGYVNYTSGLFVKTGVSQGLRDTLYDNRINPITVLSGVGLVSWGQKTRNPTASALDRVNVARLVNYIRSIFANVGNGFLFEPNDKTTRDQLKAIIEGAMNDLVAKRGIYDYLVVCDTSNNTPERIARNELYVDIAIEPMKAVEFIYIPIRLYNPGAIASLGA